MIRNEGDCLLLDMWESFEGDRVEEEEEERESALNMLEELDLSPLSDDVLYKLDMEDSFEGLLGEVKIQDDLEDLQDNFLYYTKDREQKMFGDTFVERFFSRYTCSRDDILSKSHTDLWFENTIYGLHFQAYLCLHLGLPLPRVPLRNRKSPIKKSSISKYHDPILEHLIRCCDVCTLEKDTQRRLAPRNQISILVFIMDILNHPYFRNCIRWRDKNSLLFEILQPNAVAYFWMVVKDNEMCSFENFTRAIRFKRNAGIFTYIDRKKRRVYQFHKRAIREYKMRRPSNTLSGTLWKILGV